MSLNTQNIFSVTLILFSIIDILGALPVILELRRRRGGILHPEWATIAAGILMVLFLFVGKSILGLFGLDVESFSLAGAIVIFLIALEMILDRQIFGHGPPNAQANDYRPSTADAIVPIAFPLVAGAGTLTTILSLRSTYPVTDILVGIILNLIVVYLALRASPWIDRKLGRGGSEVLRKVFGIILLAISIKLVKSYFMPSLSPAG